MKRRGSPWVKGGGDGPSLHHLLVCLHVTVQSPGHDADADIQSPLGCELGVEDDNAKECEREVTIAKASRMDHLTEWKEAQQEIQNLKQRIASYEGSTAPATIASGTNARVTPPRQGSDPPPKSVLSSLDNEKR